MSKITVTKATNKENQDVELHYLQASSDFGRLHLIANDEALLVVAFDQNWPLVKDQLERRLLRHKKTARYVKSGNAVTARAQKEIARYQAGLLKEFTTPIAPLGTDFEMSAWKLLAKIPFGKTRTYRQQAIRLQRPIAIRAVAAANARNPVSIMIPCHRVTGENGALTGYSGGTEVKKKLLELESSI